MKNNTINISRIREACLWLKDDEAYMVYYKKMAIRVTPALGTVNCFHFTLSDIEFKRNLKFIMLPEEFEQYFSVILNKRLDELWYGAEL